MDTELVCCLWPGVRSGISPMLRAARCGVPEGGEMAGAIGRALATLLVVIFCTLGVALLMEVAASDGDWR